MDANKPVLARVYELVEANGSLEVHNLYVFNVTISEVNL